MHNCRETIITRLTHINMIIRMNELISNFPTQNMYGPVGNNLIGIHIGLGARTGLPNYQRKLIIQFSLNNLISRLNNHISYFFIQSKLLICQSCTFFKYPKRTNYRNRHFINVFSDIEVLEGTLGLGSP